MAEAFVAFIERKYRGKEEEKFYCNNFTLQIIYPLTHRMLFTSTGKKPYKRNMLEALTLKLTVMSFMSARISQEKRDEVKQIAKKMIPIIRQLKAEAPSPEKADIITHYELGMHYMVGQMWRNDKTKGALKESKKCLERALDLANQLKDTEMATKVEFHLATTHDMMYGVNESSIEQEIEAQKVFYKNQIKQFGQDDERVITTGRNLAFKLEDAHRTIEALRLFKKLLDTCRRVNGPHHHLTQQIGKHYSQRRINVLFLGEDEDEEDDVEEVVTVQVLRYANEEELEFDDGAEIVVRGPITNPRMEEEEVEFNVPWKWKFTFLPLGTPVEVRGLKNATHLNGKIGDIRNENEATGRFEVHFEDENLKPCLVKQENLRIMFELPNEC